MGFLLSYSYSLVLKGFARLQRNCQTSYNFFVCANALENTRSLTDYIRWIIVCEPFEGLVRIDSFTLNGCIRDDHLVDEALMCTWYEDLYSWDHSREVDSADASKWRRRAELEYNHWGIGARRMR